MIAQAGGLNDEAAPRVHLIPGADDDFDLQTAQFVSNGTDREPIRIDLGAVANGDSSVAP